jgi:hypothetical protein
LDSRLDSKDTSVFIPLFSQWRYVGKLGPASTNYAGHVKMCRLYASVNPELEVRMKVDWQIKPTFKEKRCEWLIFRLVSYCHPKPSPEFGLSATGSFPDHWHKVVVTAHRQKGTH